uniref:GON-4-like protein n=1 Tax=Timema monikensis TaxID=170555 RepID=A0A7R9ECX9_9NEOP|nr:unnamed protein product [Timema monikensis]
MAYFLNVCNAFQRSSRKRNSSDLAVEEVEVLSTMEDELEKQLDAKASKSNLSVANVKNILKHVITNEHVLAMVRHTMKGNVINNEDLPFQPKLTRAKTKELMKAQPELSWPVTAVTPIKKPLKCHVLMDQELPEDSSDEEYNPNDEDQSDDEKENESMASDLDSQPRTPATITLPPTPIINDISTQTSWTDDGLFKMPQENIGQRTRSKFSLSDTPLETIEQAFIPPDITTDMYDLECDDEDWNNFLKDFTKPLTPEEVNDTVEDDEDADPEYNILADEEEVVDHEELRMDRAVKVSKKELNALFNELFEYTEMRSSDDEEPRNMTEPTEQIFLLEPELLDLPKETIEVPPPPAVEMQQQLDPEFVRLTEQQRLILDQQMRKHVQLTTQHFLQTYAHPHFSHFAPKCKEFLRYVRSPLFRATTTPQDTLRTFVHESQLTTGVIICARAYPHSWTVQMRTQPPTFLVFLSAGCSYMENEVEQGDIMRKKRRVHVFTFTKQLLDLVSNSEVFLYPLLLPPIPFRSDIITHNLYLPPENELIAIGLEQFENYMKNDSSFYKKRKLSVVVPLVIKHMMPWRDHRLLLKYIRRAKTIPSNPIQYYLENNVAPVTEHFVIPFSLDSVKPPNKQPKELLPSVWREHIYPGISSPGNMTGVLIYKSINMCS